MRRSAWVALGVGVVACGPYPTKLESGNGYRVGFFLDSSGTLWGIPLTAGPDRSTVLGCAPPTLHDAPVTDTLPAGIQEFIAATNTPTGYRLGTGPLELLLRDRSGVPRWHPVAGGEISGGPVCEATTNTGTPNTTLQYYRLAPRR